MQNAKKKRINKILSIPCFCFSLQMMRVDLENILDMWLVEKLLFSCLDSLLLH